MSKEAEGFSNVFRYNFDEVVIDESLRNDQCIVERDEDGVPTFRYIRLNSLTARKLECIVTRQREQGIR